MLELDDRRWSELEGGYRVPFDPRPALRQLERGVGLSDAWRELWDGLHHQGDVGLASYAAVPHLVRIHAAHAAADWNTYALLEVIEWERHVDRNPTIPDWLKRGGSGRAAIGSVSTCRRGDRRTARRRPPIRARMNTIGA